MKYNKPCIVESPLTPGKFAIAYPLHPDGEWKHKDDLKAKLREEIDKIRFIVVQEPTPHATQINGALYRFEKEFELGEKDGNEK